MTSSHTPMPGVEVTDDDRVKEVNRILSCKKDDWHGILNVEPNCNPLQARRAAIKSFLLIKDRFETGPEEVKKNANQATQLIQSAADALKVGRSYVDTDANGDATHLPHEEEQYNPSQAEKEVYAKASESIHILFEDGVSQDREDLARFTIYEHNETIRDIVLANDPKAGILEQIRGFINVTTIMGNILVRRQFEKAIKNGETGRTLATQKLGELGWTIHEYNERKGYPLDWNWDKEKHPELFVSKPSINSKKDAKYSPGQTRDGDTILGYIPTLGMDGGKEIVTRCKYMVEVNDDENLGGMEMMSWARVGLLEGQAYNDQPEKDKRYIPHSSSRYNTPMKKDQFKELLGFWARYSSNPRRWGNGYCWISLKDDTQDVVSKSCFESIVGGRDKAHLLIYALFDNDQSKYLWREPSKENSNLWREGPFGPVEIQRTQMIENGPHSRDKVTDAASQGSDIAPLLAEALSKMDPKHQELRDQLQQLITAMQKTGFAAKK